jgi:hypothetical protein
MLRTGLAANIDRVDPIRGPRRRRVARGVDSQIDTGLRPVGVDEQDRRKPRMGGRVILAAGIAAELPQTLIERPVDVERPSHDAAIGTVDRVRGVDHLNDEAVPAEPLIRRLELLTKVGRRPWTGSETSGL